MKSAEKEILRILFVCSSTSWGGAEMSVVKIAKQMSARKHKVIVVAHPKGRILEEIKKYGIEVIPMRFIRHFDPFSIFRLVVLVRDNGIDIVHCHSSRDLAHLFWLSTIIPTLPIVLDKQVASKISKKDLFHRLIYNRVTRIFVLSAFLKQNILDTCPVSEDKVVVIPGGVRVDDYNIQINTRQQMRKEWHIDENNIVFGAVCRIDKQKGLEELVRAYAPLFRKYPLARLVIVGEPTVGETGFAEELNHLIRDLGIEKGIFFSGYRSDIPRILSAFDVFVLPSYAESFGYVFTEALAAKLPVIATNTGGVPDIIENGICGILVPPKDPNKLEGAMEKLLFDEALRKKFGNAGRTRVETLFNENKILDRIEDEYYSILQCTV